MASQKLFVIFVVGFVVAVVARPQSLDVYNARDDLNPKESDVVKRKADLGAESNDIADLSGQKISLAAFIDNIESGLLQTALSVEGVASNAGAQVPVITSPRAISKRSTVEDNVTAQPVVLVQTTEKVGAVNAVPAHVVIDRVSVFKAPASGAVLFPTFHLQETVVSGETGEVLSNVEENQYVLDGFTTLKSGSIESGSSESIESDESSSSSEEVNESSSTSTSTSLSPSSTTVVQTSTASALSTPTSITTSTPAATSSTTKSTSPSTTALPVDEKKNVEKELKEKVAEVEADPVILTARV